MRGLSAAVGVSGEPGEQAWAGGDEEQLRGGVREGRSESADAGVPGNAADASQDRAQVGRGGAAPPGAPRLLSGPAESAHPSRADGAGGERETDSETARSKKQRGRQRDRGARRDGGHVRKGGGNHSQRLADLGQNAQIDGR